MVFYILLAILLFGLLIAVHEWGHFITAKLLGVRVNEFSIGMGPLLYSKQKGETLYSLRAIPMGGFCAMEGEDEEVDAPGSFSTKPVWKQLIILVAGAFMNFVAGLVIVLALFSQSETFVVPVISGFADGFAYESEEGLMVGDEILSIDGHNVSIYSDISMYFTLSNGETMDLVVKRGENKVELNNFPLKPREYTTETGETVTRYGIDFTPVDATPTLVLQQSWDTTLYFARSVWLGLSMLVKGDVSVGEMAGPVGIVSLIGETGAQSQSILAGLKNVFYIIALVSVNLAIMNLLPIPALDGGRIFLILVGKVFYLFTRRTINPKYEGYLHAVGFALLILLMLTVTFQDILRLVR